MPEAALPAQLLRGEWIRRLAVRFLRRGSGEEAPCGGRPRAGWPRRPRVPQKILKMEIKIKPELFLLSLMEKELEKKFGTSLLCMLTAARLLYAQKWKDTLIPSKDEWLQKLMELVEMAKLTTWILKKEYKYFSFHMETTSKLHA